MILTRPLPLIAARLASIRQRSGTAPAAKPGFFVQILVSPLSTSQRVERARRAMARLRARFGT